MLAKSQVEAIIQIIKEHFGAVSWLVTGVLPEGLDIKELKEKEIILPHFRIGMYQRCSGH
jgi:hypothetical protein